MKKILIILLFTSIGLLKGQSSEIFDKIVSEYESFNYEEVVRLANVALGDTSLFNTDDLIEIYLMKSVAHFTSDEEDSVRKAFIEILKINNDYKLDQYTFSPKIVNLFEKVKSEFSQITGSSGGTALQTPEEVILPPVRTITDTIFVDRYHGFTPWTYIKSAMLPGWGHIEAGNDLKGYVLSGLSVIFVGSAVYYAIETSKREQDYLNASTPALISETYDSYNSAYQIRNGLILGYLGVWLYSQFDLVMTGEIENGGISPVSGVMEIPEDFKLSLSIPF